MLTFLTSEFAVSLLLSEHLIRDQMLVLYVCVHIYTYIHTYIKYICVHIYQVYITSDIVLITIVTGLKSNNNNNSLWPYQPEHA